MNEKEKIKKLTKKRDELEAELVKQKVKTDIELNEYKGVLKEAEKWKYNNLELRTIENRFFIMSEIETDQLKKLSLRNLYNAVKNFNDIYGEKISNGKN